MKTFKDTQYSYNIAKYNFFFIKNFCQTRLADFFSYIPYMQEGDSYWTKEKC